MRAGPLSNPKVIELLNGYFVPVYTSNDFISGPSDSLKKEQKERERVYRAFLDAKLSAGSVHVYVLSPDDVPIGSIHVAKAGEKDPATGNAQSGITVANISIYYDGLGGATLESPGPFMRVPGPGA